jgi:hypothetical protein
MNSTLDTIAPLLTALSSLEVERGLALMKEAASPAIYEKLMKGLMLPQAQERWTLHSFHLSPCLACETDDQKAAARLTVMRATMEAEVSSPALDAYRSALRSIKKLVLHMPPLCQDVSALRCLPQLESLLLEGRAVIDFGFLSSLERLQALELHRCDFLTDLEPVVWNTNLQSLKLWHCDNLQEIEALSKLPNLAELRLDYCPVMQGYKVIGSLTHLREFNIDLVRGAEEPFPYDLTWVAMLGVEDPENRFSGKKVSSLWCRRLESDNPNNPEPSESQI